jgi:hypothetical protein
MAAITAAVISAGVAIYSAKKSSDNQKAQNKLGKEAIDAADPFKQYRPQYAEKLNALMQDPTSIESTPEYKARITAAQRQMAAQGYTGSGNAIEEAANGAGQAFEQAFSNLSMLSGAGVTPGGGYNTAIAGNQAANDQYLSSVAGVANNFSNLALTVGNRFNQPATTATSTNTGNVAVSGGVGTGPA